MRRGAGAFQRKQGYSKNKKLYICRSGHSSTTINTVLRTDVTHCIRGYNGLQAGKVQDPQARDRVPAVRRIPASALRPKGTVAHAAHRGAPRHVAEDARAAVVVQQRVEEPQRRQVRAEPRRVEQRHLARERGRAGAGAVDEVVRPLVDDGVVDADGRGVGERPPRAVEVARVLPAEALHVRRHGGGVLVGRPVEVEAEAARAEGRGYHVVAVGRRADRGDPRACGWEHGLEVG